MRNQTLIGYLLIAISIATLGFCIKQGMNNYTYRNRTISARGVAERVVMANVGHAAPIKRIEGNDINRLRNEALEINKLLKEQAVSAGIADSCIKESEPYIYENDEIWDGVRYRSPKYKYTVDASIKIYTSDVKSLDRYCQSVRSLSAKGVFIDIYPVYEFTLLNDIKPAMISEATHAARIAAEQFAKDSGSKTGRIKSANQGYFSIDDAGGNKEDYYKNVRVVTSVEFYLND